MPRHHPGKALTQSSLCRPPQLFLRRLRRPNGGGGKHFVHGDACSFRPWRERLHPSGDVEQGGPFARGRVEDNRGGRRGQLGVLAVLHGRNDGPDGIVDKEDVCLRFPRLLRHGQPVPQSSRQRCTNATEVATSTLTLAIIRASAPVPHNHLGCTPHPRPLLVPRAVHIPQPQSNRLHAPEDAVRPGQYFVNQFGRRMEILLAFPLAIRRARQLPRACVGGGGARHSGVHPGVGGVGNVRPGQPLHRWYILALALALSCSHCRCRQVFRVCRDVAHAREQVLHPRGRLTDLIHWGDARTTIAFSSILPFVVGIAFDATFTISVASGGLGRRRRAVRRVVVPLALSPPLLVPVGLSRGARQVDDVGGPEGHEIQLPCPGQQETAPARLPRLGQFLGREAGIQPDVGEHDGLPQPRQILGEGSDAFLQLHPVQHRVGVHRVYPHNRLDAALFLEG
mmetsp:Transcript_29361/g.87004  ORF Transcript_29361/g.87004 Transcript_29361/m.87004 type:complete len:453 (+) Transcript_29361:1295-2653(+)